MAARIGNSPPASPPVPPPSTSSSAGPGVAPIPNGVPTDPRRDMLRELLATRLAAEKADGNHVLRDIVNRGEQQGVQRQAEQKTRDTTTTPASSNSNNGTAANAAPRSPATSENVQRALQTLQRDHGLPITGRFDDVTTQMLRNLGIGAGPTTTTTTKPTAAATPAPVEKKPVDLGQQQVMRQRSAGQESLLRARVETTGRRPTTPPTTSASSQPPLPQSAALDRVLDPARLIASLFAAGFTGKSPDQALSSFQSAKGLPTTGQLDPKTIEQLVSAGHVSAEAAEAHKETKTAANQGSSATSTGASSDKAKTDSARQQAATAAATKAGDGAVRGSASSATEARELARVESLLAAAAAVERGVQEGKGNPTATAGHGAAAGKTTGLSGKGGSGGGDAAGTGDAAAHASDGPDGDESSVGNAKAGDDDHNDERRGHASDANVDDHDPKRHDGTVPVGHYLVLKLSEQVIAALETIYRIDDHTLPVHYTWDVTLYRPGVYSDGQPAEALWHLVVQRAHAFDPVWERAQQAIASRLLYVEPDADPLPLDELLGALRRARVR